MPHNFVLAASRPWLSSMGQRLEQATGHAFYTVSTPEELQALPFDAINPRSIFVPHWSWIIPETIWSRYETIIFHMTDLPFGRGGSPLQNLIQRGFTETKMSALRCTEEVDAGPVYMKRPLSLHGSAEEIYLRAASIMEDMIVEIIDTSPRPVLQSGEPTFFARRKPEQSNISKLSSLEALFDHIRMLDAEGYPAAFLETDRVRMEFRRASLRDGKIEANVTITLKENDS